jgi:hypothetical protein
VLKAIRKAADGANGSLAENERLQVTYAGDRIGQETSNAEWAMLNG